MWSVACSVRLRHNVTVALLQSFHYFPIFFGFTSYMIQYNFVLLLINTNRQFIGFYRNLTYYRRNPMRMKRYFDDALSSEYRGNYVVLPPTNKGSKLWEEHNLSYTNSMTIWRLHIIQWIHLCHSLCGKHSEVLINPLAVKLLTFRNETYCNIQAVCPMLIYVLLISFPKYTSHCSPITRFGKQII